MAEREREGENARVQFLLRTNRTYSHKMTSWFRVNKSYIAVLAFTTHTLGES